MSVLGRLLRASRLYAAPTRLHSFRPYGTAPGAGRPGRSLLSLDTVYPFLLLSAITSLALNLSHSRSAFAHDADHLRAQLSVLESLVAHTYERARQPLAADDHEAIERRLELVGLGRGKDKAEQVVQGRFGQTAWGEVFFGKKGREWEGDHAADAAEWDQLLKEAAEDDAARTAPAAAKADPPAPVPDPPRSRPAPPSTPQSSQSDIYL